MFRHVFGSLYNRLTGDRHARRQDITIENDGIFTPPIRNADKYCDQAIGLVFT